MADMKLLVDERPDRLDTLATWLPRIALAMVFVSVGKQKFEAQGMWVRVFNGIGFGTWFRYLTGVMQVGGGLLLLIPRTAAIGFILVGCTMVGAVIYWFTTSPFGAIIPGGLLLVIVGVGWSEVARLVRRNSE